MANCVSDIALVRGPVHLAARVVPPGPGAVVDFCGNVRPLENNVAITGIEYEAHEPMAQHQMRRIAAQAAERFGLLEVTLHHRLGFVAPGETSLFLRVTAPHRAAAYTASEWIVDELKQKVPIWKNPVFAGASSRLQAGMVAR